MNSNSNALKIVLMSLGIIFALSTIINTNLDLNAGNIEKNSEYSGRFNLDEKCLKISKVWGPINIDDTDPSSNWGGALAANICNGSGTYSDPYIIKDLVIDAAGSGSCIFIRGSNVFFEIRNCTVYGSEENEFTYDPHYGGIRLLGVSNAKLINNTCSFNSMGILLQGCVNGTISGNTVNNNTESGIYMWSCDNNTISGNSANNNEDFGIYTQYGDNNTISGNIVNNNNQYGIFLDGYFQVKCTLNIVSGNIVNNNNKYGIEFFYCEDTVVLGNEACYNGDDGIYLWDCNNNTLIGNNASNNNIDGIWLRFSNNTKVLGNWANNNYRGISLWYSHNNTISENEFIGNAKCWEEVGCEGNIFENNNCVVSDNMISGYNIFFLFGTLFIIAIIMNKNIKKSSKIK